MSFYLYILFGFSVVKNPGTLSFYSSEIGLMIVSWLYLFIRRKLHFTYYFFNLFPIKLLQYLTETTESVVPDPAWNVCLEMLENT